MIISYQLLQTFLSFPLGLSPKELGDKLTQQGLEVERFLPIPPKDKLALGKIVRVENGVSFALHPETQEEISVEAVLEKDCRYVLDCLDGDWGFATPARLGWSNHTTLLWVPSGLSLEQAWEFDDQMIELSITPNRGDCLSYVGIAREVALSQKVAFSKKTVVQQFKDRYKVVWDGPTQLDLQVNSELAPLYAASKVYCPTRLQSPFWLQRFLIKHGLSCRMPSVDISQYLMLVLGQPTHAFDAGALQEKIEVGFKSFSNAIDFFALDGKKIAFSVGDSSPVILNGAGQIVALPGLIGSKDSASQIDSRELILEAAFFDPTHIRSLRKHGLVTDSSLRFERGIDRQGHVDLLEIFCGMLQSMHPQVLCWSPQVCDHLPREPQVMQTTFEKLQALAGVPLSLAEVSQVIALLGGSIDESHVLSLATPSWRFDLPLEQNFLAELLRAYGINRLVLPAAPLGGQRKVICAEPALTPWIERGFNEVVTYSFGPKDWALISCSEDQLIEIRNPLNQSFAVMRPSLWPSLLEALAYNKRQGGRGLGVVEIAPIYHKEYPLLQKKVVSAALYLQKPALSWNQKDRSETEWSYFAIKGLIGQLGLQQPVTWNVPTQPNAFLHPTLSAELKLQDRIVGLVGLIHPEISEKFDWPQAWLIQLDVSLWENDEIPLFQGLSKYQKIQRDFSFVCPSGVTAKSVVETFQAALSDCIEIEIFDYYEPEGGDRTIGVHAVFQRSDRTLSDEEILSTVNQGLEALRSHLGVSLKSDKF